MENATRKALDTTAPVLKDTTPDTTNVISLDDARRAAAETRGARGNVISKSIWPDGKPPMLTTPERDESAASTEDALSRVLLSFVRDAQGQRDLAREERRYVQEQLQRSEDARALLAAEREHMVALLLSWDQHAAKLQKFSDESERAHHVELAEARVQIAETGHQAALQTEYDTLRVAAAERERDDALAIAQELLNGRRLMGRWTRSSYQTQLDALGT